MSWYAWKIGPFAWSYYRDVFAVEDRYTWSPLRRGGRLCIRRRVRGWDA
jgi:hypothetical protein